MGKAQGRGPLEVEHGTEDRVITAGEEQQLEGVRRHVSQEPQVGTERHREDSVGFCGRCGGQNDWRQENRILSLSHGLGGICKILQGWTDSYGLV